MLIDRYQQKLTRATGMENGVQSTAYNSITPTTGSFQTFNIKTGKFWARTKNGSTTTNYDGAEQTKTLDGWLSDGTILNNDTTGTALSGATPFDSSGLIASYSVNIGSGLPGSYKGYVDNVTFGTTTTNFENVAAAPEPSQWAGLGFTAFGALGLILKARKKKSAVSAS